MMRIWTTIVLLTIVTLAWAEDPAPQLKAQTVLVLPLSPIGDVTNSDWIGTAVQQNLFVDLTRHSRLTVAAPTTQPIAPGDLDAAKKAALAAGAGKVVFGSYQLADGELRLTGQMYDLVKGEYVGSFKATGPLRDLFSMEDLVASQVRKLVPNDAKGPGPAPANAVAVPVVPAVPAVVPAGPMVAAPPPAPMPWDANLNRYRYGMPWYPNTGYWSPYYYPSCLPSYGYGTGTQVIIINQGSSGGSSNNSKGPVARPRGGNN